MKKEEELFSKLSDEEKELFTNYVSAYNEFSSISIADGFVSGSVQNLHMTLSCKISYNNKTHDGTNSMHRRLF